MRQIITLQQFRSNLLKENKEYIDTIKLNRKLNNISYCNKLKDKINTNNRYLNNYLYLKEYYLKVMHYYVCLNLEGSNIIYGNSKYPQFNYILDINLQKIYSNDNQF